MYEEEGRYYRTVNWYVWANEFGNYQINMDGIAISDTLPDTPAMAYTGDGVHISVYDQNGQAVTGYDNKLISWDDSSLTTTDKSWSYTMPSGIGRKKVVITYQTKVDVTDFVNDTKVTNDVSFGPYGGPHGEANVGPVEEYFVKKKYIGTETGEDGEKYTTWTITLTVPKGGMREAFITDDVPHISSNDQIVYNDDLVSYSVSGLRDDETYTYIPWKDNRGFELYFHHKTDDAGTVADGLVGTGEEREVVVTVVTKVNKEWVNDGTVTPVHRNDAGANNSKWTSAEVTYADRELTKVRDENYHPAVITYNGKQYRPVKYHAFIKGLQRGTDTEIVLQDTVDMADAIIWSSHKDFANPSQDLYDSLGVYYGTKNPGFEWHSEGKIAEVTAGANTNSVTFRIGYDKLKQDDYGKFFPYYCLVYYVLIPVNSLQARASTSTGLKGVVTNTATWEGGDTSSSATYEEPYDGLDKELLNGDELSADNRGARFRITLNPLGATVNGGRTYTVTDQFSDTLAVDYSTLHYEPADAVTGHDVTGNVITFWVKDGVPVTITYTANVRGSSANLSIWNSAKTTWTDEAKAEKQNMDFSGEITGGGDSVKLRLLKVDGDNNKIRLPNVKFILGVGNWGNVSDASAALPEDVAKRTFVTNANGEVTIEGVYTDGTQGTFPLYFDTEYTLTEVESTVPEGYTVIDPNPYTFVITSNGSSDWIHYRYPNNYALQIKNYKKKGNLEIKKTVVSDIAADASAEYSFTVTLYRNGAVATDINAIYDGVTFAEGVATGVKVSGNGSRT